MVALNRAVAVGEVHEPPAGLSALDRVPADLPRHAAVRAYLHERAGEREQAVTLYVAAARTATSEAERDHLNRPAARLPDLLGGMRADDR